VAEHTPGPWYASLPRQCSSGCRRIRTEKGRRHGGYFGTELAHTDGLADDDEDKANARLIAAAPDLLSALRGLISATYDTALARELVFADACAAIDKCGEAKDVR